jgi:N-acetylneuraminic acid mutarotase
MHLRDQRRGSFCVSFIRILLVSCALLGQAAVACTGEPTSRQDAGTPSRGDLSWRRLPDSPSDRTEVTATSDGERVFVIGGLESDGQTVPTVEIYDPEQRSWGAGPALTLPVNHAMSAAVAGTIYVLGGYRGPGLSNPTDRAFALQGGRWIELPRMPETRAAGGAAAMGDRIYVAGGVGPDGLADRMLVFDVSSQRWATLEGPPTSREHLGVAALGGRLYVMGGRTGSIGSNLATAESFDPRRGTWDVLSDMPTARGGIAAAATSNGFVLAIGGEAETAFDEAEALDVGAERWLELPPMPSARHGLGAAAIATVVYVIAGGTEPGYSFSSANEAIDLAGL